MLAPGRGSFELSSAVTVSHQLVVIFAELVALGLEGIVTFSRFATEVPLSFKGNSNCESCIAI